MLLTRLKQDRSEPVNFCALVATLVARVGWIFLLSALGTASVNAADPFAANNALYPPSGDPSVNGWSGPMRPSNFEYPSGPVAATWNPGAGLKLGANGLTQATAPQYAMALKSFLGKTAIPGLVNTPLNWSPLGTDWYDMPWGGEGKPQADGTIDPESGREAILGSYTGQILQPETFPSNPPKVAFQNHAVIYYNGVAASMLGRVWANPFEPDVTAAQFPEGSIVVKVEAATLTPSDWPPLAGSSLSYAYRPTTAAVQANQQHTSTKPLVAEMIPLYFSQMAVKVKDSLAAPETGWVFVGFTYISGAPGTSVWDKALAIGAMWGNDPEYANDPNGLPAGKSLQQTWVQPGLPPFVSDGLGWGGRLAGPMDVGRRHNVITVSGKRYEDKVSFRATSCLSCHSSAQYPFVANLYASPNLVFPEDGQPFLFFDPGSPQWAKWFQNRSGRLPMSGAGHRGITATDYDMLMTFALMTATGSAGEDVFVPPRMAGH